MNTLVSTLGAFTRGATIDNFVFRMHYRATLAILVVFACLVGFEVYLGSPINCISDYGFIPAKDVNRMCWLQSTYTQEEDWGKTVGMEVPHPGVGLMSTGKMRYYYHYYHWVLLTLCLQSIFCYLPRYFWKRMEGGKISQLTLALRSPFLSEDAKESKMCFLAEYLAFNMNNHQLYFACYVASEIMNFANVVAQICFINVFLGGDFSRKVTRFREQLWNFSDRSDPLIKIFPRFTKCTLHRFAASGDIVRFDVICMLPINTMNEKIYVFLWFWFVSLAVLSGLALVYRVITVLLPRSRSLITSLRVRMVNRSCLEAVVSRCGMGDWLIVDLLSRNLDPMSFSDVLNNFARRLEIKNISGSNISLKAIYNTATL